MNKRKRHVVDIVVAGIIVLGSVLWWRIGLTNNSGFHQNGKVGLVTEEKEKADTKDSATKTGENTDKERELIEGVKKRERVIKNDTDYASIDNNLYAWWFKRNDNHEQSECQRDFDIREYDAYYVVPVKEKKIYITFDCGYENGYTPDILDTLKEENVPAAFFVTKTFIRDNVELVKRMKEEGHLVCNHTVHHPSMPSKSIEEQRQELLDCEQYMKEATGYDMDLFFRPPKGEYSKRTLQMVKDLGYTTIFWSIAYLDYDVNNQPTSSHVVEHFAKYYHPGAIPLIHNVSVANRDALKTVLQNLKKEGYSFGNLEEIWQGND